VILRDKHSRIFGTVKQKKICENPLNPRHLCSIKCLIRVISVPKKNSTQISTAVGGASTDLKDTSTLRHGSTMVRQWFDKELTNQELTNQELTNLAQCIACSALDAQHLMPFLYICINRKNEQP
jgi:hypothetical protein